jgi:hypothetical protein
MSLPEPTRELAVDQRHVGTAMVAGVLALVAACLSATWLGALFWWAAVRSTWLVCLLMPTVFLVMFAGFYVLQWSEPRIARLWPSNTRLLLEPHGLHLTRRRRIKSQILWNNPFVALRWRTLGADPLVDEGAGPGRMRLACQLSQGRHVICVFTDCTVQAWRRVPGWTRFSPLEGMSVPGQAPWLPASVVTRLRRRQGGPAHREASPLPQAERKSLWRAERRRRRQGWALSFDDFRAIMEAVEPPS